MNYIDKNIRTINQEPTIGIIICKKGNEFIMQYVIENNIYELIDKVSGIGFKTVDKVALDMGMNKEDNKKANKIGF